MANLHPNTSGLKPFNQMTPEEALVIQRLGGIAHAKRNDQIILSNDKLEKAYSKVKKEYQPDYDPEADIYEQLCKDMFNPNVPLAQRVKAFKYIQSIKNQNNKRIDEQNLLRYKTAPKEFQSGWNLSAGFREGSESLQSMEEDIGADQQLIDDALREAAEEEAAEKGSNESAEKES